MTRKIAITARQVTALCKGAAKAGYIPEIVIGDVVVRLVPEHTALTFPTASSLDREFNEWDRELQDDLKLPIPSKQAVLSRSNKATWHTEEIEKQRAIRHAKVSAQWESDLRNSDLEHRERRVMGQLLARPDEPQHISTIALAGPVTVERLLLRGFLETTTSATGETETLVLTDLGRNSRAERGRGRL